MARMLLAAVVAVAALAGVVSGSFAVVVHRSNPTSSIRLTDLRAFFWGEIKQWPHGVKVVLVDRDLESEVFRFLMHHVLNSTAVEYQRRLANIEFKGETPVTVRVLNSDGAACKFVFNVRGSIALIATNSLALPECAAVQLVSVDGKLPGDEKYGLR
jgi:ABC-type phosphate transport system substrate-binding protein